MSYSNSFPTQNPVLNLNFATGSDQFLDSRLSYTRSSTGTYLSNEKALNSENLLPYSNDLSQSVWTKSEVTVPSNNNLSPDGGAAASSVLETATTGGHSFYDDFACVSGTSYTFTLYAKSNGRSVMRVAIKATATIAAVDYDLTAVSSTVSSGAADSHSITAIGSSGWYKLQLTVTGTSTGTGRARVYLHDGSSTSYAGDATKGAYIWGCQVSSTGETVLNSTSGSIHREYSPLLKTAAADAARFEYASDGQSEGLLIEQQYTQYSHYSEEFDNNGGWAKTAATVEPNAGVAPDGTLTADLLVEAYETSGTNSHYMRQNTLSSVAVGETYTWTIFAKAAGRSGAAIYSSIGGANVMGYWDLTDGSVTTTSGTGSFSSTDFGNGWYRLEMTFTTTTTAAGSNYFYVVNGGVTGYQGNGYGSVLLWGANLTKTGTSMSYVKAEASTATKAVDSCSVSTADIGYTGGPVSVYADANAGAGSYPAVFGLSKNADVIRLYRNNSAATEQTDFVFSVRVGNVPEASDTVSGSATVSKIAVRADTNNSAIKVSGLTQQSDTSCIMPVPDTLEIGDGYGVGKLNGTIRTLRLWNVALSDTELQAITS